ncbi:MAG TPA: hypothetical protein GXX15_01445 [Clostridia bacterium]|nr:hypothetical protein [Clostridia bacterium]
MKKLIALVVAVILFTGIFVSSGYAADLIIIKTDIDDVKTENKYFVISGSGQPDTTVELILNDDSNYKWVIDDSGLFAKLLTLKYGDNYVIVKAYKGDQVQIIKGHLILTKKDGFIQMTITAIEELLKAFLK